VEVTVSAPACVVCGARAWRDAFDKNDWHFVRCTSCGLVRLDPQPTRDELVTHYASRAQYGNYELARSRERDAGLAQVFAFAARLAPTGARRILDLGCFDGALLDAAARAGWETTGVELQPEAAAVARAKHGRIITAAIEDVDPATLGNGFDVVTAIDVIEHLLDPAQIAWLAASVLRSGGILVLQTPNLRSVTARVLRRRWPFFAAPEHTHYFDARTLAALCARHDLDLIEHRRRIKRLRVGYVYDQLEVWAPGAHRLARPVFERLPRIVTARSAPLYGGELLLAARRR
jgi:2-polyprenyl-3-methyl-5-hydroxy-6-metoxy-1,4-benzoquinol methylase